MKAAEKYMGWLPSPMSCEAAVGKYWVAGIWQDVFELACNFSFIGNLLLGIVDNGGGVFVLDDCTDEMGGAITEEMGEATVKVDGNSTKDGHATLETDAGSLVSMPFDM